MDFGPLPERIGQYEVLKCLAVGGMAQVLLARLSGADGFRRHVVIKRVLPQFSDDSAFVDMFRDEARITSQLHHGNIVQVLEFGELDGSYYLVLEYVNGPSLGTLLRQLDAHERRLSIPEVAHIAVETARALDYAHHKRGVDGAPLLVVHRDVSPSNILLSREGEVKLTDFGIARARARLTPVTQGAGVLKGKIPYMPPEALKGKAEPRSDLFALGTVLFEMLTGRLAFAGDSELETIGKIVTSDYPPPSSLNPAVPTAFEQLVTRMMATEVSERPERGLEIVEALAPLTLTGSRPVTEILATTIAQIEAPPDAQPTADSAARIVLVIDQSRTLRALLRTRLAPEFKVVEAAAADEARALLRDASPSAIVSQSSLPGTTGVELCRTLGQDPVLSQIPFVLLAADPSPELEQAAALAGVKRVLPKPLDVEKLKAELRALTAPR